jgi:hypothetical protein
MALKRHYKLGQRLYRAGQTGQAIEELYIALSACGRFITARPQQVSAGDLEFG